MLLLRMKETHTYDTSVRNSNLAIQLDKCRFGTGELAGRCASVMQLVKDNGLSPESPLSLDG